MEQLSKKTVSYFYDEDYANHSLGGCNPMRPHRVRLTQRLLEGYGLTKRMQIHRPRSLSFEELNTFHADEYLDFLQRVTPKNQEEFNLQMRRFNLGPVGEADCPVFDGMFQYCKLYSGGSRDGALNLIEGKSELAFNWAGGMHHAKRAEASGFCYINDIVLGILELLKHYHRVLYVDIDIHHGDGVEEAFYLTDRVMTVSFHKYGDFFPGTGSIDDTGYARGSNYSVNVPLREGMDDASYHFLYEPIMQKVMEMYQPGAVVVCAGADSLSGDRLGCFNLSLQGHSSCLEFLAKFDVPVLMLGGGGYTMRNVSRCWAYETGRLQGIDLPDELPQEALAMHNYYMDTRRLRIETSNMMNLNTQEELAKMRDQILQQLSQLQPPSGAAISAQPPVGKLPDKPEEDPDVRGGGQIHEELRAVKDGYDSDEEPRDGRAAEQVAASEEAAHGPAAATALDRNGDANAHVKEEAVVGGVGAEDEGDGGGQDRREGWGSAGEDVAMAEGGGAGVRAPAEVEAAGVAHDTDVVMGGDNGGGVGVGATSAVEAGEVSAPQEQGAGAAYSNGLELGSLMAGSQTHSDSSLPDAAAGITVQPGYAVARPSDMSNSLL